MADELEPVRQVFDADMAPYVEEMRHGEDEARRFAEENRLSEDSVERLIGAIDRLGGNVDDLAFEMKLSSEEMKSQRDAAEEDAAALGHLRDNAIETAHEEKKLRDETTQATASMTLMNLAAMGTLTKMGMLPAAIAALVGVGAGIAPAFVAAGLGVAAFGLVAKSAISSVMPAVQAYEHALNTTGKAHIAAMKQYQQYYGALSSGQQNLAQGIIHAEGAWQNFVNSALPGVTKVLAAATTLISPIFSILGRFLGPVESALQSVIGGIQRGLQSAGFQQFITTMVNMVGPAIAAISKLAGSILHLLGGALTNLAPLAVPFVRLLAMLVNALSGPLIGLISVLAHTMYSLISAIIPLIPGLSKFVQVLATDVIGSFRALLPILTQVIQILGPAFLKILMDLEPVLANVLTPNGPFILALSMLPVLLRGITPLIVGLADLLSHPIFASLISAVISAVVAGKALIAILTLLRPAFALLGLTIEATPIGWVITAIAALVFVFVELWKHCAGFRDFWKGLWADIQRIMAPVVSWIHNVIDNMTRWWHDHGDQVMKILKLVWAFLGPFIKINMAIMVGEIKLGLAIISAVFRAVWDVVVIEVRTAWTVIKNVVYTFTHSVYDIIEFFLNIVQGHWSAAWHNLLDLASTQMHGIINIVKAIGSGFINILYSAGRDIVQGLINGITSMIGSVTSVVSNIGSSILGGFKSILGIGSPSRVMFQHGIDTFQGWINGAMASRGRVADTMRGMAGMIRSSALDLPAAAYGAYSVNSTGASSAAAPAAPAAGGMPPIIVYVDGRKLFEILQPQIYQYNVRNSGVVTGVVKPGTL